MSIWRSFWGEQGDRGKRRILLHNIPLFMKMLVKVIQLLTLQLVVQVTKQLVVRVTKLLVVEVTKLSMAHLVEQLQPRKRSAGTARQSIQLNSRSARVAGG